MFICDNSSVPAKEDKPAATTEQKEEKKEEQKEEKAPTEEAVTIRYWQHSSAARDEVMTKLADDFMKENPNIKVQLEFVPEDSYTQKLIPALASGTAPDVFQLQSGMINRLAKQGSIQPLDESIISGEELDKVLVPSTIEALKVDDKYYGLPTDVQTVITFWNKALVAEAGLDAEKGPQTWEEMREWAIKLTKTENGMMTQSGWGHKGYFPEVQALESLKASIVGNLQMGQLSSIWQTGYESIILTDRPVQEVLTETQNLLNEEIAKDIK